MYIRRVVFSVNVEIPFDYDDDVCASRYDMTPYKHPQVSHRHCLNWKQDSRDGRKESLDSSFVISKFPDLTQT